MSLNSAFDTDGLHLQRDSPLVDAGSLSDPSGVSVDIDGVAPRTPLEQTIAEVWQELIGVDQIGIHDDYLQLGGDSLLAGQIVVTLRRRLALPLSVRSMFENDTIAQLADHIERLSDRSH